MEHKNKIIASAICNYECKHKEWCNGRCNVTIELEPYIDRLVATAKRELMAVYDEYIKLLGDELKDMAGLMVAHGWHSSRVEAGKICREKIQALKKEMEG